MAHIREAITSGDLADLVSSGASATVYPSDDTVLQVLQSRFRGDLPYARAGATSYIVVNPMKSLANVNDASAKEYEDRCYKDTTVFTTADMPRPLQPHMYELAARMYLLMRRRTDSQVALFQGITGSGKSSSCALLINQVLRLATKSKKEHRLAEQIKAFRTVLDSFGDAKTVMNPSASRHSRYFELHFNEKGRLAAGKVLAFALDKSRLIRLSQEERSYHIFYQLLAGATPAEQDLLNLEDPSEYALLASSGCYRLPGGPFSDDSLAMEELRGAMRLLGFKTKHVQSIFTLVVAILVLGNINFLESPAREESASIANPLVLDHAARLLGVEPELLAQALTNRTSYVRKELYTVLLNAEQARQQRDTMVQALYAILFAFMVETANHKIAPSAAPTTVMAFLDTAGAQARNTTGSISINPLIAAHGHGTFEDLAINFSNELVHSYIVYNTFEDRVGYNSHMVSDGINLPEIMTMDNSGCVELLKGLPVPDKVQKRPEGLLGAMHKASINHKSGRGALDEDLIADMVAKCGTHDSFVTSPALGAPGSAEKNLQLFGINHYTGSVTYDVGGFVEKNADLVDPALVTLLRESKDVFVAKLLSGPTLATETHDKDESIVVQAQVSSRPLRLQDPLPSSNGSGPSLDDMPQLDLSKCYPVTTQINYTLSSILTSIDSAKLWTVSCIRPNDSGSPNSFDKRRVRMQIRSLLLPDTIARRNVEFVVDYTHDEFCDRYVPTMQGTTSERIRQCTQANGWKNGQDFSVGHRSIWLTYQAWKMAEDELREKEPKESGGDEESIAPGTGREVDEDVQSGYLDAYKSGNPFDESRDNLLLTRTGTDGTQYHDANNPFNNSYGVGGLRSPNTAQTPGSGADEESAWGSEWDKKRDLSPGANGVATEKPSRIVKKEVEMNTVEEVPTSKSRRWWLRLVWIVTWWMPSFLLVWVGRMKRPDVRLAWREKVTICFLIFFLCGVVIFYIVFFGRLLCPQFDKAWLPTEVAQHTGDNDFWVSLHGQVYDISTFWRAQHSDAPNEPVTRPVMEEIAGQDLTNYFPPPLVVGCPALVTDPTLTFTYRNFTPVDATLVHTSGFLQTISTSKLHNDDWYSALFLPSIRQFHKGPLVWSADEIKTAGENETRVWAVWDNDLYDLTDYFWTIQQNPAAADKFTYLNSSLTDLWQQQPGQDISKQVNALLSSMSALDAAKQNTCIKNMFRIGSTDFRKTARCQVQNYLLLAFSVILVTTIAAKFLAALQLTGKRMPEMLNKFVICQVPCYTEGEESLRRTIDSLAGLKYDNKRKLMFIICDGNIMVLATTDQLRASSSTS